MDKSQSTGTDGSAEIASTQFGQAFGKVVELTRGKQRRDKCQRRGFIRGNGEEIVLQHCRGVFAHAGRGVRIRDKVGGHLRGEASRRSRSTALVGTEPGGRVADVTRSRIQPGHDIRAIVDRRLGKDRDCNDGR